ncbi:response regulator receiver domain-containing protein [Krasilnikovia cinnamomea]|uniref:Response regulator receiver domain-containing protein n=1 Tax=Krasilnikovia cinnamomea TaxID=349313 RepID=A0A4Q7Z988_9ACTN|nr:response regulator [Krasilnikovia cinnamomea]RZU46621.1 response regulator receiver domain-containing protein [Krasilnikovia cinnamomea]
MLVTADDDDEVRTVIQRILQGAGHTVIATTDGAQAWAAVREHRPDAVVTDVSMPQMSGVELCEAIRADPHLAHIPVVAVSGSIGAHDVRSDACFTAFVAKPFTSEELLARLDSVLAAPGG